MKGILTKEHILHVEKEAQNPMYRMQGVISFAMAAKSPFAIIKITPKGLIFIQGTDDTGFKHIHQRHSGNSQNDYWVNFYDNKGKVVEKKDNLGRKKLSLDNPSSFHPHSIPIFDYLNIADQVFGTQNLNNEKNKKKDVFDVYDGLASGINKNEIKYRLLTYKDSKIVHTLIPLTKKFNKQEKRIIHFARQNPKSITKLLNNDFQIEIPYKDEFQIIRYVVIVRNDIHDESKEKWYIQVNSPYEAPLVTEYFGSREKDFDIYSEGYLRRLENVDFTPLEKMMKKMEKRLIPRRKE
jgi:hypothetical protein